MSKHFKVLNLIGITAGIVMLLSIFLPYVAGNTGEIADELQNHGITPFGAMKNGISQFTYAMVYLNSEKAGLSSDYVFYAVLFFIAWEFIALVLVFQIAKKPKAVITFSVLTILMNLLLRYDYLDRGIVGGFMNNKFGISLYQFFGLSALEIILSILMIIERKNKHSEAAGCCLKPIRRSS